MKTGSQPNPQQVVVTEMGIVSAIGVTVNEFRDNLFAGKSGIQRIQTYDTQRFRTQIGAEVRDLEFTPYVERTELIMLDRLCLLAIVAADEAVADAALELDRDRSELGVILGTGLGASASVEESMRRTMNQQRLRPTTILKLMLNSPAATLCARYQCREVSHVHVTACAASAHAMAQAADYIRRGQLDICLAGGSDAFPSETIFSAWDALGVMSPENENPRQAMRPFSVDRKGFAIGEGAAVLVLESKSRAEGRGARIYAELAGSGSCSHTPNLTRPSVDGMAFAMSRALQNANVAVNEVGYINAHGTATELNDVLESQALHQVFGDHARKLQISSTKAAHGHTMGAAGAIEAVATILGLQHGLAPPTLNLLEADPHCDLDYTPNAARHMDASVSATNSFAFGGHYVSLVFKRCGPKVSESAP